MTCRTESLQSGGTPSLLQPWESGTPSVVPFYLADIAELATIRIYLPKDLRPESARRQGVSTLTEALQRVVASSMQDTGPMPAGADLAGATIPVLDVKSDLKVDEADAKALRKKRKVLLQLLHETLRNVTPEAVAAVYPAVQGAAVPAKASGTGSNG